MKNTGVADIAFVIDTSGSMNSIFDYLIDNLYDFVMNIQRSIQTFRQFDIQLAVVAGSREKYFIIPLTKDTQSVAAKLKTIRRDRSKANEVMYYGIDLAMVDLEWRFNAKRIMVMITDEPLSGNYEPDKLRKGFDELISRFTKMRILLYVISPRCRDYEKLGAVEKSSIYFTRSRDDYKDKSKINEVFEMLNKSISKSMEKVLNQESQQRKQEKYIYHFPETEVVFL